MSKYIILFPQLSRFLERRDDGFDLGCREFVLHFANKVAMSNGATGSSNCTKDEFSILSSLGFKQLPEEIRQKLLIPIEDFNRSLKTLLADCVDVIFIVGSYVETHRESYYVALFALVVSPQQLMFGCWESTVCLRYQVQNLHLQPCIPV